MNPFHSHFYGVVSIQSILLCKKLDSSPLPYIGSRHIRSCLVFEAPALKSSGLIFRNYIVRHLIHFVCNSSFLCVKSELYFISPFPVFLVRLVYISSVFYIFGKVLIFPELKWILKWRKSQLCLCSVN